MLKRLFLSLLIAFQPAIALAVPDEVYVDPAINANSGTGTSGDPYGDVQYALDSVNHGGDGANFNVKAGTAEVLAAGGLSLDTYFATNGAPGPTEPGCIRGYTATAGDGGIAEFTGVANSAAFWVDTTTGGADTDNWSFIDLKITTAQASGYAINIDNLITFHNVELISNHGGIDIDQGTINHCSITYVDTKGVLGNPNVALTNSYVTQASGAFVTASESCNPVTGNVFNVRGTTDGNAAVVLTNTTANVLVEHNTILANISGGGTANAAGIRINSSSCKVANNYIEGFNSVNDEAIDVASTSTASVLANNAYYGNTATVTDAGLGTIIVGSTTTLGASGVTDAAGGDYTPTSALIDAGYPSGFLQVSGNANYPTIGAITTEHSAGGSNVVDPLTGTIPGL